MNEIKQVMMSEDRSRRAEIFSKNDVWHVNMIIGGQLIECRPMISDGTVHSLHYAEDAAENWCVGIIE
jgi:hypothetical protein